MATSGLTPGPRELINVDGRSFGDELADLEAALADLHNDDRRAYRDRNSAAIARHPAAQLLTMLQGAGRMECEPRFDVAQLHLRLQLMHEVGQQFARFAQQVLLGFGGEGAHQFQRFIQQRL